MPIKPILLKRLACPYDGTSFIEADSRLHCSAGHSYPVIDDVPVILLDEGSSTFWVAEKSREVASCGSRDCDRDRYYVETLGISNDQRRELARKLFEGHSHIDPVVSSLIAATNGIAYKHLVGELQEYPIPELRLPPGNGEVFLDVGCGWGRWSIAAAKAGYRSIGIEPSLGAALAAKRVAAQLGLEAAFVVGDARRLPFLTGTVDVAFSYSVFQHFSRDNAVRAVGELGRVLRAGGTSIVQMPTILGLRCLYHQARRRFRDAREFEVRYWTIPVLRKMFTRHIGTTTFSVDCFFGIGLQSSDSHLMPILNRAVMYTSELLRSASQTAAPWLYYVADSVYVKSTNR